MQWNPLKWFSGFFSRQEEIKEPKEPPPQTLLKREIVRVICRRCHKKVIAHQVKGVADLALNSEGITLSHADGSFDIPAGIEIITTHRCNNCDNKGIIAQVRGKNYLIDPSDKKQDIN